MTAWGQVLVALAVPGAVLAVAAALIWIVDRLPAVPTPRRRQVVVGLVVAGLALAFAIGATVAPEPPAEAPGLYPCDPDEEALMHVPDDGIDAAVCVHRDDI